MYCYDQIVLCLFGNKHDQIKNYDKQMYICIAVNIIIYSLEIYVRILKFHFIICIYPCEDRCAWHLNVGLNV